MKIIITGPESCGKTTLCRSLAKFYNTNFVKEFARSFLNKKNIKYNYEDLLIIAHKQFDLEQKSDLLFYDTDLITIKIWSKLKYSKCDSWITEKIKNQEKENRFYLLCKPDIPWEPDPMRENKNDRDKIFEVYKSELDLLGHSYKVISGKKRFELALNSIKKIKFAK
tara:strand:+ start:157 stop:657 length:501 start_codon:yes stop_codon:yes gene_type:complete